MEPLVTWRRVTVALAAAAIAMPGVGVLVPAGAGATPLAPAQEPPAPATAVAVVDHSFTLAPGAPLEVRAQVSGERPESAELFVEVYPQVPPGDRAAIERAARGQFDTGTVAPGPVIYPLADVPPDDDGILQLAIRTVVGRADQRIGAVRLAVAGVYPLRVSLRDGDTNDTLASTTTFFVRLPEEPIRSELATALVVPLDAPVATPASLVAPAQVDPAARQRWAATLAALAAAPDVPVTLVPRPETVAALARSTVPADRDLHAALRSMGGQPHQVLAPPYVDVDAAALVANGRAGELTDQLRLGFDALAEGLGVRPDRRTWLAAADLDAATAGRLDDLAVDQWVVPPDALGPVDDPAAQPQPGRATRVVLGDQVLDDVAVPDQALSSALAGSGGRPAAIRLLAELASRWFATADDQRPGRGVVLVMPPGWTPDAELVAVTRAELAASPLLEPVTIDDWFAAVELERDGDSDGAPIVRRLIPSAPPDLGALPSLLTSGQSQLDTLASFLPAGSRAPEVRGLDLRLAVMASSDLSAEERVPYVTQITERVDELKSAVARLDTETITLTSREATLTVTLENGLTEPVRTLVTLESSKLTITDRVREVLLEPGVPTALEFPVEARSTGSFGLTVSVGSPDGSILMRQARWTIRSTALSGVGWVLSIGGLVFLAGWWAAHARRDRRAERAAIDASARRHPSGLS